VSEIGLNQKQKQDIMSVLSSKTDQQRIEKAETQNDSNFALKR